MGLAVTWEVYGDDGHVTRPSTPTMQSYRHCMPTVDADGKPEVGMVTQAKIIVQTARGAVTGNFRNNVHTIRLEAKKDAEDWLPVVDEVHRPYEGPHAATSSHKTISLLHFAIKSEEVCAMPPW